MINLSISQIHESLHMSFFILISAIILFRKTSQKTFPETIQVHGNISLSTSEELIHIIISHLKLIFGIYN